MIRLNTGMQNRLADSLSTALDSGTLKLYTGSQPSSGNDAATGTLLATLPLPADSFSAASGGIAAKTGTWTDVVDTGGTPGWFRAANAGDTLRVDGNVGSVGSGADLELDNTTLVAGGNVVIASGSITQPAAGA